MSDQRKRVLIVGGVAGGASCAARMRRMDENAEIVMFEKGPYVSFANCGLPYHASGVIAEEQKLLLASPQSFYENFRVDVRVNHEVTRIDREVSEVEVVHRETGETTRERYDALVLAPGADAIRPPLPGIDLEGIFTVRTVPDVRHIRQWIEKHKARRAVVVGGGFIGLEMAENLIHRGLNVSLIEMLPQVMPPLDAEMVEPVHAHLREKGVELNLGDAVASFEKGTDAPLVVKTKSGASFPADLVILSIGVKPKSELARDAGLELGIRDSIKVDDRMRTSDPRIYAVGDAVEVWDVVLKRPTVLPLAGPANRQGRIAADNIAGRDVAFRGVQGTAVVGVFDLTVANTGANERSLREAGVPYEKVYLFPGNHVGYYPGAQPIHLKMLFDTSDGRVLGAQAVGREGVEKRIDVIAMAIQMKATVYDLEETELCYAPQYGAAKDPINMAAFIAANHLRGDAPLVHWQDVYSGRAQEEKAFLLDVRPGEVESIAGFTRIPLPELRDRLNEIPRDRPVWAHCGVGQSSYYATRLLRQRGYQAFNLSGGIRQHAIASSIR